MTENELIQAIANSGLTSDELTALLRTGAAIIERERFKAQIEKTRAAQAEAFAQYEAEIQALQNALAELEKLIVAGV